MRLPANMGRNSDNQASQFHIGGRLTLEMRLAGVHAFRRLSPPGCDRRRDRHSPYTVDAARLIGESDRLGTHEPGRLTDVVAYRRDPMSIPVDELSSLRPAFTMVGGRIIPRRESASKARLPVRRGKPFLSDYASNV